MPVHLKGGVGDAVLYRATMGLTVLGMLLLGVMVYCCNTWLLRSNHIRVLCMLGSCLLAHVLIANPDVYVWQIHICTSHIIFDVMFNMCLSKHRYAFELIIIVSCNC